MSKKLKNKMFLVTVLLMISFVSFVIAINPFVSKSQAVEQPVFETVQNASIRISPDSSGIRFAAKINDAYLQQYDNALFSYRAKVNAVGAPDSEAIETAVAAPNADGYIYVSVIYDNLEEDKKTSAYGVELYPEFYLDIKVNEEVETVKASGSINRSMRAVAYDAYVNYTTEEDEGYRSELLLEYFTIGNESEEVNYVFANGNMVFKMPEYSAPADGATVTTYVGSEKYTATYDAATKQYTATGVTLDLNEQSTIAIFDQDNNVYSTKVVRPNELNTQTIGNLQSATSGYWVLTEDIKMDEAGFDSTNKWGQERLDAVKAGTRTQSSYYFNGVVDGQGYTISNFVQGTTGWSVGLLTQAAGTIKNLNIISGVSGYNCGILGQVARDIGLRVENVFIYTDTLNTVNASPYFMAIQGDAIFRNCVSIVGRTSGSQAKSGFLAGTSISSGVKVTLDQVSMVGDLSIFGLIDSTTNQDKTYIKNTAGSIAEQNIDYYLFKDGFEYFTSNAYLNLTATQKGLFRDIFTITEITEENIVSELTAATEGYYVLTEDIDMSKVSWTGYVSDAAASAVTFRGMLNGNGFAIKNYYTRRIIKEMKNFERIILQYNFDEAYFFVPKGKKLSDFDSTKRAVNKTGCPIEIKTSKKPIIVTKLINKDKMLFMVENIGNPMDEVLGGQRATKIEIDLGEYAQNAKFYYRGKSVDRKPINGVVTEKIHCGDALFIEVNKL